jgi:hypothetical protein
MTLPVMGTIYEDPVTRQVVADLPDWGYVLTEDPITGNTLAVAPIDNPRIDPTREK